MDTHTCPKCGSNLYAPDFDGWSCVACGFKRRTSRNDGKKPAPQPKTETRFSRMREWSEKRDWNNSKAMWRSIERQRERINAAPWPPVAKAKPVLAKPAPIKPPPPKKPTPPRPAPAQPAFSRCSVPPPDPYTKGRRAKLNQRYEQACDHLKHYRESGNPNDLARAAKFLRECFEHIHVAKNAQPLHALADAIAAEYDKRIPSDN